MPCCAGSTKSLIGTLLFISSTWLIIPTDNLSEYSLSRESITVSKRSLSKVPKPSSKKKNSRGALPFSCICEDKARARHSEVKKVSS